MCRTLICAGVYLSAERYSQHIQQSLATGAYRQIYFHFPIYKSSKVGELNRGWFEGSLFNSYFTGVKGRALLLSLDCSTLPLIRTLYCWVLSKEAFSSIFSLWYDSTWDWTLVSRTIGEHSNLHIYVHTHKHKHTRVFQ